MTTAGARLAALLLGAALCQVAAASPAAAAWVEYVLVEANEGGSSGGHVAIRFGERTYHFQNDGGRLLLERQQTERLLHDYVIAENRGVRALRVEVSDETWHELRDRFETRRYVQATQIGWSESLARDRHLLEQLAERPGPVVIDVPAAAYLEPAPPAEGSEAIVALRRRIAAEHGPGFLTTRLVALAERMRALDPGATPAPPASASLDEAPPPAAGFADRYLELASLYAALERIAGGARLRAGTHGLLGEEVPQLRAEERRALARAAAHLDARLFDLTTGSAPGAGRALLVGLARRAAIERSLATGRLAWLDAFPSDARRIEPDTGLLAPRWLAPLVADMRDDLARARAELVAAPVPSERQLAVLEEVANRYAEAERAARSGRPLRLARDRMVPARSVPLAMPRPDAGRANLAALAERAREREARWRDVLEPLHDYHLFARNCVSAIFETVDAAWPDPEAATVERLGGRVDASAALNFWPIFSARAVRDQWRVADEWHLAPYRRARVAEMKQAESRLRVALRESNTLTARAYTRSPEDSFFLFFTDSPDAVALRPLLGVFNVGAGVVQTLWGTLAAPFDRGRRLVSGVRGVVMSMPELAFFNVRKGSYPYVPREQGRRVELAVAR